MWYFRIIEFQKEIEEKRLVFGQKFENFLKNWANNLKKSLNRAISSKNFCLWSISLIFLLSLFLRSRLDVGGDSAVYLDLVAKIADGKKYYYDFYEQNFPLAFWIHLIPFYLAKFFSLNHFLVADFFVNFLALAAIVFSKKILEKTYFNQAQQNLIISSFALGFFLRYYALESGDFLTKTSFLLIFSYPYISLSFPNKNSFGKKILVFRGVLMGLIPCLKPHYIILPFLIEIYKFYQKRSLKFIIEIDKLIMAIIGIFYLLLMLKFSPEFFKFIVPIGASIYPPYANFDNFLTNIFTIINGEVIFYGSVFLIFIRKKFSSEDRILFLIFCAVSLVLLLEALVTPDQIAGFFGLISFVLIKIFYDFFKLEEFSLKQNYLSLSGLLVILFFADFEALSKLRGLVIFWWVTIPFLLFYKDFYKNFLGNKFIFLKAIIVVLVFVLLLICGLKIIEKSQNGFILFSNIIFIAFLLIYEKKYTKLYKKFSAIFVFVQFFILMNLMAIYFSAISKSYNGKSDFKSPNFLSENIINYGNSHLVNESDDIMILSYWIHESSQALPYLRKKNRVIGSTAGYLYNNTSSKYFLYDSNHKNNFAAKYFFNDLKKQIGNKNIKILFVTRSINPCTIGFLEYYFADEEFKKTFLKNYKFADRIFRSQDIKDSPSSKFLSKEKDQFDDLDLGKKRPLYDFEVYVRKQ